MIQGGFRSRGVRPCPTVQGTSPQHCSGSDAGWGVRGIRPSVDEPRERLGFSITRSDIAAFTAAQVDDDRYVGSRAQAYEARAPRGGG